MNYLPVTAETQPSTNGNVSSATQANSPSVSSTAPNTIMPEVAGNACPQCGHISAVGLTGWPHCLQGLVILREYARDTEIATGWQ